MPARDTCDSPPGAPRPGVAGTGPRPPRQIEWGDAEPFGAGPALAVARALAGELGRRRGRGPGTLYRRLQTSYFLCTRDRRGVLEFLARGDLGLSRARRLALLRSVNRVTHHVRGYHTLAELLAVSGEILRRERSAPVVLEAGCGPGASTAKLSLAVRVAGGRLLAFDTFSGVPPNDEEHTLLDGRMVRFRAGAFRGRINQVRAVLDRFGAPEVCTLHKGRFEDTLPALPRDLDLDVVVLDVDLLASTRLCARELYPRLRPGGVLVSLDGQLRATHALLGAPDFWRDEVGVPPPIVEGLWAGRMVRVVRPGR